MQRSSLKISVADKGLGRRIGVRGALVMLGAAGLPLLVSASEPTDLDGMKTANGKVVAAYLQMAWNDDKRTEADKKYNAPDVIEHGYLGGGQGAGGPPGGQAGGPPGGQAGGPPGAQAGGPPGGPPGAQAGGPPGGGGPPSAGTGVGGPHADIKKLMVQGDLVFVQLHVIGGMMAKVAPNGELMWELYRVKNGKIAEHWDTHNVIPDDQAGKQW